MRVEHADYNDKELIEFIGMQQSQRVRWGNHYEERLIALRDRENIGAMLPWGKTHKNIRLRPGELSVWAGINGHKKSMMLGQVLLWLSRHQRIGLMSFELPVEKTMQRLSSQAAGCFPSEGFDRSFAQWNDKKICYYDQMDSVPGQKVLGVVYHMANELGCHHIAIDSLMMVRLIGDKEKERRFIEQLAAAAKALQVHIHIVHHMRKPPDGRGQDYIPSKFDCRGDGGIVDKADNLFIVWESKRRRALKELIEYNRELSEKDQNYFDETPDQLLICDKQRFGDWEGRAGLWFHKDSLQFTGIDTNCPMPFDISGQQEVQTEMGV